ncbi:hypothetical protein DFH08DRAFT_800258 [Mycena albidolilacea]|uniref:Uncharacterized protein n=1 Tax=Mycena albidolilacea TaxID=1033008 RepID=A0AAD7AJL6_9AGAR|nr:hypothetical protein DFH08DRAFT_800258 [Mycena albidolilacea]
MPKSRVRLVHNLSNVVWAGGSIVMGSGGVSTGGVCAVGVVVANGSAGGVIDVVWAAGSTVMGSGGASTEGGAHVAGGTVVDGIEHLIAHFLQECWQWGSGISAARRVAASCCLVRCLCGSSLSRGRDTGKAMHSQRRRGTHSGGEALLLRGWGAGKDGEVRALMDAAENNRLGTTA